MPTINYNGEEVECEEGEVLRDILLENDLNPHEGVAKALNCGGHGTCGTCRIRVAEGSVGENKQSTRLKLSTDASDENVRLACQFEVHDDIVIEKP
jgi:ferredoxin